MMREDIKKVGVVGAGTMGHGIALNFALWGYPTLLHDLTEELLAKASDRIVLALNAFVKEKLITRKQATAGAKNITLTTDLSRLADGKPWLIDPDKFDEATEEIQRKYLRCLKEFYWQGER